MTINSSSSTYTRTEGLYLVDYETKTTYLSYSFKERFNLLANMFKKPTCENFWKQFKIVLLGYETINSVKTIKSMRRLPAPDSLKGPLFRMTYSESEHGPLNDRFIRVLSND